MGEVQRITTEAGEQEFAIFVNSCAAKVRVWARGRSSDAALPYQEPEHRWTWNHAGEEGQSSQLWDNKWAKPAPNGKSLVLPGVEVKVPTSAVWCAPLQELAVKTVAK